MIDICGYPSVQNSVYLSSKEEAEGLVLRLLGQFVLSGYDYKHKTKNGRKGV